MIRFSLIFGSMGVALLIAAPWVVMSARWPVYLLGVAAIVVAALSRYFND
jgi:hypothetical protein